MLETSDNIRHCFIFLNIIENCVVGDASLNANNGKKERVVCRATNYNVGATLLADHKTFIVIFDAIGLLKERI